MKLKVLCRNLVIKEKGTSRECEMAFLLADMPDNVDGQSLPSDAFRIESVSPPLFKEGCPLMGQHLYAVEISTLRSESHSVLFADRLVIGKLE